MEKLSYMDLPLIKVIFWHVSSFISIIIILIIFIICTTDNLEVADEILDVNERKLEDESRSEVIKHIHEVRIFIKLYTIHNIINKKMHLILVHSVLYDQITS